jgi:cytoskeleton protein RodZ
MNNDDNTELTTGQRLQQARELRKLTVQQVAQQLNLKADLITRLEQDRYDGTLETFARGYVRAYGRLLKIPEAELMAAFGSQTGYQQSSTKPMRTFSNRTAKQATENRFMWLTYAIIALLLVLLFVWWWQSAGPAMPAPKPVTAVSEAPATEWVSDAEPELPAPTPEQLNDMLEQLTPADPTLAAEEDVAPAPLVDQLEMRFSENCWVDVVDAEGNRVAYGTKQAGYVMQLTGKAPFVVTLGNPSVVSINFNQQAVDMSAFPAGRVAKFTIPESN